MIDKNKLKKRKEELRDEYNVHEHNQTQKQHVKEHRKVKLRKLILSNWNNWGVSYVPYCGDGDISYKLYHKKSHIIGTDLDKSRIETCKSRMPDCEWMVFDANQFPDINEPISLADFDAYANPYNSFLSFLHNASIDTPCSVFFTDGKRQSISRNGILKMPDFEEYNLHDDVKKRKKYHRKWIKICVDWVRDKISDFGYKISNVKRYKRGMWQIYWGGIIYG